MKAPLRRSLGELAAICVCCWLACAAGCATIRGAVGPDGRPDTTSAIGKAAAPAWEFYGQPASTLPQVRLVSGAQINCTGKNGGPGFVGEAYNDETKRVEPTCLGGLTIDVSSVLVADYGQPPWQSALCHEFRHVVMMYLWHILGSHDDPLFDKDFIIERCNAMLEARAK